jgi:hypothetical protein
LKLTRFASLRVERFKHGYDSLLNFSRYVKFYVDSRSKDIFFIVGAQENEEKALVLHTLPKGKSNEDKRTETAADDDDEPHDASPDTLKDDAKRGISTSTSTIPRLISVVEIIKREYLAGIDAKKAPNLVGLYQYNEMGCLEQEEEKERDEDRIKMITEALSGTKK